MVKVGTKVCQIPNQNHTKNVPKDVKSLPKWQNIVKSGHTGHSTAFALNAAACLAFKK